MGKIEARELQWFAVRVKHKQVGGMRTTTVGGDFEAYKDRAGRVRKRRIPNTGERVFLPELILTRAGFDVFLPVKKTLRQRNRFNPEKVLVAQPLLVGWIFVAWPVGQCRWADLMALDVVSGVMGTGGRPVQLSQARVQGLMRQWGGGMLTPQMHRWMKAGCEFAPGDRARVVEGPLEGKELSVVEVKDDSVKALMDILGGQVPVEIGSNVLESLTEG